LPTWKRNSQILSQRVFAVTKQADPLNEYSQFNKASNQGENTMASTHSIRQRQVEIGILEHEGIEYTAFGATVCGREITAYIKYKRGHFWLATWAGGTTLDCRSEVIERFWSGSLALMFRLPKGKYIVGYALGDDGMLFRGELIDHCSEQEARRHALTLSDNWAEVDAEDEEAELTEA
jgi:hypothetical protein